MSGRHIAFFLNAVMVTASAMVLSAPVPSVSSDPCPDVEVVFARGTDEPPGVGVVGQAFVDALRPHVGTKSLDVYPVAYAASSNFGNKMDFAKSIIDGITDAGGRVEHMAANCPNTRIVLGGYSQGAVIAGFVTAAAIPPGIPPNLVPAPMPPDIADHVASVVLFGKPSDRFMHDVGAPLIVIGPLYVPKTSDLCAPDDTVCNGTPSASATEPTGQYAVNGMVGQAADFTTSRL